MKHAFILTISDGFIMGLLAFIEALKFYGHTEDVHVILHPDIYPYKKGRGRIDMLLKMQEETKQFNITYKPLSELMNKYPIQRTRVTDNPIERGWVCRFYAYPYMLDMDYDTYCIWQGDLLLLNNLSKYLDIAEKFTVLSNNFSHWKHKHNWENKTRLTHDMANPICNIPFITSDRELLKQVWEEGCDMGRGDMKCIFHALLALDKLESVFLVPFNNWVYDWHTPQARIFNDGKGQYYRIDGSRLNAYHGPMWSAGWAFKQKYGKGLIRKHRLFHNIYVEVANKYNLGVGK
jgi:hypothetical protein